MVSFKDLVVCFLLLHLEIAEGKRTGLDVINNFIVNGKLVQSPIPYQISIEMIRGRSAHQICGGAIISQSHVLTAAHCFNNENPQGIYVRPGIVSLSSKGLHYPLAWIKKHPNYTDIASHDIAILRINGNFAWSEFIRPIDFSAKEYFPDGNLCWVSGWGSMYQNSPESPDTLHYLLVKTISNKKCRRYWHINDTHICSFADNGGGFCGIDSGGPLVNAEQTLLVGIVSYGSIPCADGLPDVYTRVSAHVDWIEYTIDTDNGN